MWALGPLLLFRVVCGFLLLRRFPIPQGVPLLCIPPYNLPLAPDVVGNVYTIFPIHAVFIFATLGTQAPSHSPKLSWPGSRSGSCSNLAFDSRRTFFLTNSNRRTVHGSRNNRTASIGDIDCPEFWQLRAIQLDSDEAVAG